MIGTGQRRNVAHFKRYFVGTDVGKPGVEALCLEQGSK